MPDPPAGGALTAYAEAAAILFPPDLPPSMILRHPFTRGRGGRLIGA